MPRNWNMTCPLCNMTVRYWARCTPENATDYYDFEWVMHGRIKQFFHRRCYKKMIKEKSW